MDKLDVYLLASLSRKNTMKKILIPALILVGTILASGIVFHFAREKRYQEGVVDPVRFGAEGYAPQVRRDCLEGSRIPYTVDRGSLYISTRDLDRAVMSCS